MDNIAAALKKPDYIHVLINPLPVYALLIAIVLLAISLFRRNREGRTIALALIIFVGLISWPTWYSGHQAFDHVEQSSYEADAFDDTGSQWAGVHAQRADQFVYFLYGTGVMAALTIFLPRKFPRSEKPLLWLTFLSALAALWAASLIARAGGEIRHQEFRTTSPPSAPEHHHEHEHEK
jgi:hypothetical protein